MRSSWKWLYAAGSKQFLEPKSLALLLVPAAVITSVLSSSDGSTSSNFVWLVANLLAIAIVFALVLLIRALRDKLELFGTISLTAVFLIAGFLGGIKSLATNIFVAAFSSADPIPEDLWARILSGALAGAIAIPLVAAFAATRQELQTSRDELISRRLNRELMESALRKEDQSLSGLVKELRAMRLRLKRGSGDVDEVNAQLGLIAEFAQSRVRPLSHRLFREIEESFPQVSWRELLRSGSRSGAPITFLVLLNLLTLPRNIEVLGLQFGTAYAFTTSTLMFVLLKIFDFALSKLGKLSEIGIGISIGSTTVIAYTIAWLVYPPLGANFWFIAIALVLWFVQSGLVFVVIRELFRIRAQAEFGIEEEGSGFKATATAELERQKLAQLLHGQVQSRLMSLGLRAKLGEETKRDLAVRELEKIIELLSKSGKNTKTTKDLREELVAQWSGFIDLKISGINELSNLAASELEPLLEESISNAYRHGLASRVEVNIENVSGDIRVEVLDDGTGPRGGEAGLGSRLFDEKAKTWTLGPSEYGGSILRFTMEL